MKNTVIICSAFIVTSLLAVATFAQDSSDYSTPRTIDGHPDLQGVWENNTITPVERPEVFGDKEYLTDEDVNFLQTRLTEIENAGEAEEAIAAARDLAEHRRLHPADTWEDRPLGERCVSFGAPRLSAGYNSYWQIVQTKETVAIIQEMAHDVRIVPLIDDPHVDADVKLWHGDSRGWWEGDTLVVETTNYLERSSTSPRTVEKVNVERLTRVGDNALQYQLTSRDPGNYTAPYTREIIFDKTPDKIYEYACHEGNYGMTNILSGHRAQENMAAEAAARN